MGLVVLFVSVFVAAGPYFSHAGVYDCDAFDGPPGLNECVLLNVGSPYYNNYQWATCNANAYIKQSSGGEYKCVNLFATYCWYQCMLEVYGSMGPEVYGVCSCSPNATTTTPQSVASTLAPYCYSPDGSSCDWYTDCLERKYPCSGTSAGYAVEYGRRFCSIYQQNIARFSTSGQQWINAVRKCLQVQLVPVLRQYITPSCDYIRQTAFASHAPCYLSPYQGAPSICDLPVSDIVPLACTLKSAFADATTAGESVHGLFDVAGGCVRQSIWFPARPYVRAFKASIKLLGRFVPTLTDRQAEMWLNGIGQLLNWGTRGLCYMGTLQNWSSQSQTGTISFVVAVPDASIGLGSPSNGRRKRSTPITMDDIANEFENAVRNGSLLLQQDGIYLYASAMAQCSPPVCANGTEMNVTAPPPPALPTSATSSTTKSALRASAPPSAAATLLTSMAVIISFFFAIENTI